MKNKTHKQLIKYFYEVILDHDCEDSKIDIYIPILNLGIIFDRPIKLSDKKIQILNVIEKTNDFESEYQKLYYEKDNFELLWNSLMLYLVYNFDSIFWKENI